MSQNMIRDAIDAAKVGASGAVKTIKATHGTPQRDPHLEVYRKLTPADFDAIRAQHGDAELHRYIQEMEQRRLAGGDHAHGG